MRLIGRLDEEKPARRFSDYLYVNGVANELEAGREGDWLIWVEEDDQIRAAQEALERFRLDPAAEEFTVARQADRMRAAEDREIREARKKVIDVRKQWHERPSAMQMPITIVLILFSVGVALLSRLGDDNSILRPLFITWMEPLGRGYRYLPLEEMLRQGQVWRLVTPIFIHFGILHIAFNMLWTLDLGRLVEPRRGSLYFALLVVTIAIPSNILQYAFTGPSFGGMSGVVFGLVGYIWIRNRFSYRAEYPFSQRNVTVMLIWFVVCVLGIVGPIANWAHGVGLAVGMIWGYLASDRFRRMIFQKTRQR
jgi:GlpG protein